MKKIVLLVLAIIIVASLVAIPIITRDGELVIPQGEGVITIGSGNFEAFPLPDYAAAFVDADYKSYFIEVEPGIKVHILEVGSGFPVFLQHGNPTSGFLYRKIAEELPKDRVRLIMPTLVGLGFSSKVPASEHTLENHMRWINAVLTQLEIEELVFVGQDWGGPVGMGALGLSPGKIKGAVVLNTGFNAPKVKADISRAHKVVKTPVVGELMTEVFGSIFDSLPRVQGDPSSIPPDVIELYKNPVIESGNAKAPLALMRMVADGPDHPSAEQMRFIEQYVQGLDIPVEIVWGMSDPILARILPRMKENFPNAKVTRTEAGHFLQEEVPTEIAAAVMRVVDEAMAKKGTE